MQKTIVTFFPVQNENYFKSKKKKFLNLLISVLFYNQYVSDVRPPSFMQINKKNVFTDFNIILLTHIRE